MELRIENGRGKWKRVQSEQEKFYKALEDAMTVATEHNRKIEPGYVNELFYPVALDGGSRVFVMRISGGFAFVADDPVDASRAQWTAIQALFPAGEKPKREVSPETRERLAKNLEKARAAKRKK